MGKEELISRRVAESLGRAIVHGEYPAGSILPSEQDLCTLYSVSRTGVREALKMLGGKGLIQPRRRVGGIVSARDHWSLLDPDVLRWMRGAAVDIHLLKDLARLRLAIEPEAAALAARTGDQKRIALIGEAGHAMSGEPDEALAADVAFHAALLSASGNRFFAALAPMVESALLMSIPVTNGVKQVPKADVEKHLAIFAAIRDGRPEDAAGMSRELIAETLRLLEVASA